MEERNLGIYNYFHHHYRLLVDNNIGDFFVGIPGDVGGVAAVFLRGAVGDVIRAQEIIFRQNG